MKISIRDVVALAASNGLLDAALKKAAIESKENERWKLINLLSQECDCFTRNQLDKCSCLAGRVIDFIKGLE